MGKGPPSTTIQPAVGCTFSILVGTYSGSTCRWPSSSQKSFAGFIESDSVARTPPPVLWYPRRSGCSPHYVDGNVPPAPKPVAPPPPRSLQRQPFPLRPALPVCRASPASIVAFPTRPSAPKLSSAPGTKLANVCGAMSSQGLADLSKSQCYARWRTVVTTQTGSACSLYMVVVDTASFDQLVIAPIRSTAASTLAKHLACWDSWAALSITPRMSSKRRNGSLALRSVW